MQGVGGGGGGGVDQGLQHSMAGLQPGPPCHAGRGLPHNLGLGSNKCGVRPATLAAATAMCS